MTDQLTMMAVAGSALAGIAILTAAMLKGWQGWLELKRLELAARAAPPEADEDGVGVRIELADVRERLKKLEALASVVEL